jgi:hypothetical protein
MAIKRRLLEGAVRDDPDPDAFEGWLLERCLSPGGGGSESSDPGWSTATGPVRAMALDVLAEWRLAQRSAVFRSWLERGAPSEDADTASRCDAR